MTDQTPKMNANDFDLVEVACDCGNKFDMPFDAAHMMCDAHCGQCGEIGKFRITADPSPRKHEINDPTAPRGEDQS